jgi:hypothetical protein
VRPYAAEGLPSTEEDQCPAATGLGVVTVSADQSSYEVPLFNVEPNVGEPARFGFLVPRVDVPVLLTTTVRSGSGEDRGVNLSASEVPESAGITGAKVTFWGVPGKVSHDAERGWGCLAETLHRHAFAKTHVVPVWGKRKNSKDEADSSTFSP